MQGAASYIHQSKTNFSAKKSQWSVRAAPAFQHKKCLSNEAARSWSQNLSLIARCSILPPNSLIKVLGGRQERRSTGNAHIIPDSQPLPFAEVFCPWWTLLWLVGEKPTTHRPEEWTLGEPSFGLLERNQQLMGLRSIIDLEICFLIRRPRGQLCLALEANMAALCYMKSFSTAKPFLLLR